MNQKQSSQYQGPTTAVRALICRDSRVLLMRKDGGGRGVRYALPGGKVDPGESIIDALQRECKEEVDCAVTIGTLAFVADLFRKRYNKPPRHQIEMIFHCSVDHQSEPGNGPRPDPNQVALEWVEWPQLGHLNLVPRYLIQCQQSGSVYLGQFFQDDNATA